MNHDPISRSDIQRAALPILSMLLVAANTLDAAEIQWSATSGNFNEAAKWSGGLVPGGADVGILDNGGTLSINDDQAVDGIVAANGTAEQVGGNLNLNSLRIGRDSANGTAVYRLNGALMFPAAAVTVSGSGTTPKFDFVNGLVMKAAAGDFAVGTGSGQSGELVQAGGFLSCTSDLVIGRGQATGRYQMGVPELESLNPAMEVKNNLIIGDAGGSGILQIKKGSMTKPITQFPDSKVLFGVGNGSTAEIVQTGGTFVNNEGATWLGASGNATASWTMDGGLAVLRDFRIGNADSASGELQLNAGSLNVGKISTGSTGESSIKWNGGTIVAVADESDFMSGLTSVSIGSTSVIDTREFDITIGQDLTDAGGTSSKPGWGHSF